MSRITVHGIDWMMMHLDNISEMIFVLLTYTATSWEEIIDIMMIICSRLSTIAICMIFAVLLFNCQIT